MRTNFISHSEQALREIVTKIMYCMLKLAAALQICGLIDRRKCTLNGERLYYVYTMEMSAKY